MVVAGTFGRLYLPSCCPREATTQEDTPFSLCHVSSYMKNDAVSDTCMPPHLPPLQRTGWDSLGFHLTWPLPLHGLEASQASQPCVAVLSLLAGHEHGRLPSLSSSGMAAHMAWHVSNSLPACKNTITAAHTYLDILPLYLHTHGCMHMLLILRQRHF